MAGVALLAAACWAMIDASRPIVAITDEAQVTP
jgi:hypothetical protein